ncbi:Protein of unknown function (DUF2937) [Breoghania corrubedonensis]|uniref:DUF2937 family protein n=1 Tax=Breoghania corrubedonensis TaxID=665038 RepID=A0A2T5VHS9_9HYPH|nr:DUF2937 family protein [Breoghania corrubedonensis]PTW63311.1 Protein of unknown function (DUF2937) [Breoghania corrubedonensis]
MIVRTVTLAIALVMGTLTSQFPEFAQQYRQRLAGAIDALGEVVADFRRDAEAENLSPQEAIARLESSGDSFARRRAASMERTITRLDRLIAQWRAMERGGPFARLNALVGEADPDLVRATASDFEPAVPVTIEGLVSALVGLLVGLFGTRATVAGSRGIRKRMRRRRALRSTNVP